MPQQSKAMSTHEHTHTMVKALMPLVRSVFSMGPPRVCRRAQVQGCKVDCAVCPGRRHAMRMELGTVRKRIAYTRPISFLCLHTLEADQDAGDKLAGTADS